MNQDTLQLLAPPAGITYSKFQSRIFEHFVTIDGRKQRNFAISAVAGSGKSFTIREFIKLCVKMNKLRNQKGERAWRILSLQFNSHIRKQMQRELGEMPNVDIHTMSSAGLMVLKLNKMRMKGSPDRRKYNALVRAAVQANYDDIKAANAEGENKIAKEESLVNKAVSQLTDIVNMTMNTLTDPLDKVAMQAMVSMYGMDCLGPILFELADLVIKQAMEACKESCIAFPDMIYAPLFHECEFPKYDIILCDEFQDFNAAQLQLIESFCHKDTIVGGFGDAKQSIMMFTGAMSDSVDQFTKTFNCRTLPLSVCYRCPSKVLDLARIIVPWVKDRDNCPEGIVEVIETKPQIANQVQPGDYILCRLTAPLVSMCLECIKLRKPAKVKGKEIGTRITKMYEEVLSCALVVPFTCEEYIGELKQFREAELARLMQKKASAYQVDLFTDTADCLKVIADYLSIESRNTHGRNHHSQIKTEIDKLFAQDEEMNENPDRYITLCTVHKAKGLEADNVFILEIHNMPFCPKNKTQSTEARQQESNILYVALTRPKKALYVHGENITNMEQLVNHIKKCEYVHEITELEVIS